LPGYTSGNTTNGGALGNSGGSYRCKGGSLADQAPAVYGNYADPNDWGSGGAGLQPGAGGGLAPIRAEALQADGRDGVGSGGGISVQVGTLKGSGLIRAAGRNGSEFPVNGAGRGGRAAVYAGNMMGNFFQESFRMMDGFLGNWGFLPLG
jgi:large repetitive protein